MLQISCSDAGDDGCRVVKTIAASKHDNDDDDEPQCSHCGRC